MKIKRMTIGIKSLETSLEEFRNFVAKARQGERPAGSEEVNFVSLEDFQKFFTPKRMELLHYIHHKEPRSLYELAKGLGRDRKNVMDDVSLLARVGLIQLKHKREGRERAIPTVVYDRLAFEMAV